MALAVEAPAREDLSFRTNDDKLVGARWLKSDATTPVGITSGELALRFDPPPTEYDPDTGEPIPPLEELHTITSTTPGDTGGWIDPTLLASGIVLVTIPHGIWSAYVGERGVWDLVAVGEGTQRCLVRGCFIVEDGIATPGVGRTS